MTRNRLAWLPYFRHLADRLALRDWSVHIMDEAPDKANTAEVCCVYGQKRANVYLSDNFLNNSEESQRQTATHELIHCHWTVANQIVDKLVKDSEYHAYQLAMEYGVDGLADALAPLLPLPSAIVKTRKRVKINAKRSSRAR